MFSARRLRIRSPTHEESSSSVSSVHVVASNNDLLSEILLCLPIKKLLKFKSVSKHWLSLITDTHFCRRRSLKPNPASILFLPCNASKFDCLPFRCVPLDPLQKRAPLITLSYDDRYVLDIVQSCNGLLCCCSLEENAAERTYYICNPTTEQFKPLPPLYSQVATRVLGVNLVFDPSKSHVYHVVCIQQCKSSDNDGQILIYSSETGAWRVSGAPFVASLVVNFDNGVYWNGAIHWLNELGKHSLYFDLNDELVREMPMPPLPEDYYEWIIRYFGECGGHLHLIVDAYYGAEYNVYEMKRDRSGWFVKFRIDPSDLDRIIRPYQDAVMNYDKDVYILCVVRGEIEEDSFLVLQIFETVIRYNLTSRTYQEICRADDPLLDDSWQPRAFLHVQSLAPI